MFNPFLPEHADLRFTGGNASIQGYFNIGPVAGPGSGSIEVRVPKFQAKYGALALKGGLTTRVLLSKLRVEDGSVQIAGTRISFEDIGVEGAPETTKNWGGDIEVTEGSLRLNPITVYGTVHGAFIDARPVLAVFGATANLPPFLYPMLRLKDLKVDAQVRMQSPLIDLPSFRVRGGPFDVKGALRVRDGVKNGALLIAAGPLSVGVGVRDDKPLLQIFDPLQWFDRQVTELKTAVAQP